jgi:hypothetical protein
MRSLNFSTPTKLVAALAAALCLATPALALAQQSPDEQGQGGPPPTYAQPLAAPAYGRQDSIKGTLAGFDGQWVVYMHDDKGYTDHITLHQGTVINPTGIKLLEGMKVTVFGQPDGPTFQANRVDVGYSPYSPYYGSDGNPAYGYGDPGYGYGGGYGYGYGGYGGGYGYPGYGYPYGGLAFGIGIGWNWGWGWGWGWPGYYGCCGYYRGYYPWRYGYGYPYRYGYPYYRGGYYRGGYYRGGYYRGGTYYRGGYYRGAGGGYYRGSVHGNVGAPVHGGGRPGGGGGSVHGRP